MPRIDGLIVATLLALATPGCNGASTNKPERPGEVPSAPSQANPPLQASGESDARDMGKGENQEEDDMKVKLTIDGAVLTATLIDSAATRDFLSLLPLDLTLRDYSSTEKVSDLPRKLSTEGAPDGMDPEVGDITYYAPWGNLAIFYRDFGYAKGLVELGHIDSGIEKLANQHGEFAVRIEKLE